MDRSSRPTKKRFIIPADSAPLCAVVGSARERVPVQASTRTPSSPPRSSRRDPTPFAGTITELALLGEIAELLDVLFGDAQLNGFHAAVGADRLGHPPDAFRRRGRHRQDRLRLPFGFVDLLLRDSLPTP